MVSGKGRWGWGQRSGKRDKAREATGLVGEDSGFSPGIGKPLEERLGLAFALDCPGCPGEDRVKGAGAEPQPSGRAGDRDS